MVQSEAFPPLPTDTVDAARSVFNIENVYISIGDQIEGLFSDLNLLELDVAGGEPAKTLCLLAMVTIFQFAENMPDRQAVEALRIRTDWKYALHLSLVYPGLVPSSLCDFRQNLLTNFTGQGVFQSMLVRLAQAGLLSIRTENWSDARSVLLQVCSLSRVDWLVQSMDLTLEALAAYQPELLREVTLPHWYERYKRMPEILNQSHSKQELEELARAIGKDAQYLLGAIQACDDPAIAQLPEVKDLRRVYHQQFETDGNYTQWREVCSFCSGS